MQNPERLCQCFVQQTITSIRRQLAPNLSAHGTPNWESMATGSDLLGFQAPSFDVICHIWTPKTCWLSYISIRLAYFQIFADGEAYTKFTNCEKPFLFFKIPKFSVLRIYIYIYAILSRDFAGSDN